MQNLWIYLIFIAFLVPATYTLLRARRLPLDAYRVFLMLLVPAFLLVIVGVGLGIRFIPEHRLVIHGYRVQPTKNQTISVGSDVLLDDVRFHYRFKGRELIEPGLIRISFGSDKGRSDFLVRQNRPQAANVVSLDGLPIRSLPLESGVTHRITFGAFNHSKQPRHVLEVSVKGGKPVFRYQGHQMKEGFSRDLFWGLFGIPYPEGRPRHLAVRGRINMPQAGKPVSELLGQASVLRYEGRLWLTAADADIRLDDRDFPTAVAARAGSVIAIATREVGEGRASVAFRLYPPASTADAVLDLIDTDKRRFLLPAGEESARICLTASESYYSRTRDIKDPQFPASGLIINREGNHFVFRGQILQENRRYQAGHAELSIERPRRSELMSIAWFGVLFLSSVLFVPASIIRKQPLIGVVIAACVFLLAFRQLLAFRAWQGPPFKLSVLMDSLTAPFLFMLIVLVISIPFHPITAARWGLIKLHNFFFRGARRFTARPDFGDAGLLLPALAAYGLLIWMLFHTQMGSQFPVLILGCLGVSLLVGLLDRFEQRVIFYSAVAEGGARWRPALWLVPLFLALMLAAPLLGGREVISILPGRPRPDIFLQVFLLFVAAYLAGVWVKERLRFVPNPWFIMLTLIITIAIPFGQGVLSRDMGFFAMVGPPILLLLLCATWRLDQRLRMLGLVVALTLAVAMVWLLKAEVLSLENIAMRRLAFFLDKDRIKAEYFFDYLAHLPMLWAAGQGFFGGGFFTGRWFPALDQTSVNDNVASVFIQGELGAMGTFLTMGIFALLAAAGILFVSRHKARDGAYPLWFLFGISLMLIWVAGTMFLANLGYFPLTGKNLPLLGLDSLNDVVRYALLAGFMVRYMNLLEREEL